MSEASTNPQPPIGASLRRLASGRDDLLIDEAPLLNGLGLYQGDKLDAAAQLAYRRELEKALGHQLLKPAGRGVATTEAGQAAFARAEEIFQLGQLIPDEVREAALNAAREMIAGSSPDPNSSGHLPVSSPPPYPARPVRLCPALTAR